jgi:glutamate-1-semialdehyde 2,1-aminomutase
MEHRQSAELYQRAAASTPGGVHSNTRARSPHPIYFERAEGPYLYDVDGNRYLDFVLGNGAIILGHGNPEVQQAVAAVIAQGLTTGSETRLAVEAAELLLQQVPTAEMVRFANSGTEAVMHALELARSATGRRRVAKVEGAYHGWDSQMYVSAWPDLGLAGPSEAPQPVPAHKGLDADVARSTIILPFNDVAATRRIVEEHADELAAVIVEPVMMDIGYVEATREYIHELRRITKDHGIVFIFDELLTGFRVAPGGAQSHYGVTPDLSTFGKAIANGYAVAAVAGRREIMDEARPGGSCAWVGTFNGHAVSMAAVGATLRQFEGSGVWRALQERMTYLEQRFARRAKERGVDVVLRGRGGNFHWYFTAESVQDYRSAATSSTERYQQFAKTAAERGIHLAPGTLSHHSLTVAHEQEHLDAFVDCL